MTDSEDKLGRVEGYEYHIVCPECGYPTDAKDMSGIHVVCGSDVPGSDDHGCGTELEVIVRAK